MKKIVLFFSLFFTCLFTFAQTDINLNGIVVEANGNVAANVEINIYVPSNPFWIYSNTVYTDVNGQFSDSFTAPISQGVFFVEMVDCDSSVVSQSFTWFGSSIDLTATFLYCDNAVGNCGVWIAADSLGGTNGTLLTANPSGTGPFTYMWSDGSAASSTYAGAAGTYCVTITDANGCAAADCIEISSPVNCSVTLVASPAGGIFAQASGTAPFTYSWNTGETTASIFPMQNGTYCVDVTDANGCVATACFQWNGNPNDTLCHVTLEFISGALCVQANAEGVPPFTYEWSDGSTGESACFTNVTGSLCVTVTDATNCISTACETITNPNCNVDILLTGSGALSAVGNNVSGPFTYQWNTGETTQSIFPTQPGLYCVTITTANGCTASDCYTYNGNPIDSMCAVTLEVIQGGFCLQAHAVGTAPFTYIWSNNSTGQTACSNNGIVDSLCVTVVDATGCVATACGIVGAPGCSAYIQLTAGGGLTAVGNSMSGSYTYQWNTGELTQTIYPMQPGLYCVTITDANGCVADACYDFVINPNDSCSVSVVQVPGAIGLFAIPDNNVFGVTYLWDTGETTASIVPDSAGTYCVTITTANGCEASDCGYWSGNNNNCTVYIEQSSVTGGITAITNWNVPAIYIWSTGDSTQTIYPTETGEYCVVAINPIDSCVATACYYYFAGGGNIISGFVSLDSLNGNAVGTAFLIQYEDVNGGTLTLIDSTQFFASSIGGAYYEFNNVADGEYLVKVALDPNSAGYDNHLPTYYGDVLFWDDATSIFVPDMGNQFYNITMVEGENPGGPGFVGGLVIEGANFTGFADTREDGDPVANVLIILLDENGNAIAYDYTDEDGEYGFGNLPWGTYQVIVEILGFEQAIYMVTIGPNNPSAEDITFEVDEDSVSIFTTAIEEVVDVSSYKIYPNPVASELTIDVEVKANTKFLINFIALDGKLIKARQATLNTGRHILQMDVSDLPKGLYFLNMVSGTDVIARKLVKQ